jgi:hypothetical protein
MTPIPIPSILDDDEEFKTYHKKAQEDQIRVLAKVAMNTDKIVGQVTNLDKKVQDHVTAPMSKAHICDIPLHCDDKDDDVAVEKEKTKRAEALSKLWIPVVTAFLSILGTALTAYALVHGVTLP